MCYNGYMTEAMIAPRRLSLRSGGFLWGPRRVALGMSLRELEEATGIYRAFLSRMENGVMIPTGDEFDTVMRAIEAREAVPPG